MYYIFIYACSHEIHYIFIGLKLDAHPLTISTAASLYHRYMREAVPGGYDPYVRSFF